MFPDTTATSVNQPQARVGAGPATDWRLTVLFMGFGLVLFLVTIGLINIHAVFPYQDVFVLGSFALIAAGAGSAIAISLKLPLIGQTMTAGGVFAGVIGLFWVFGPSQPKEAIGYIEVPNDRMQLSVRTKNGPLFTRRGDKITHSVMVTATDVQGGMENFMIVLADTREIVISCIPMHILQDALRSNNPFNLVVVSGDQKGSSAPAHQEGSDFQVRVGNDPKQVAYGKPIYTFEDCRDSSNASHPAMVLPPPALSSAAPTGEARRPAQDPNPASLPAVTEPAVPATPASTIAEPVRQLRAPDLDQRITARNALTDVLTSNTSRFASVVQRWDVAASSYDEDLGFLSSWLPLLRRSDSTAEQALGSALSQAQSTYLTALLAHPDRTLRLAAKETLGWLIKPTEANFNIAEATKFIKPLQQALAGNLPALQALQAKAPTERLRTRSFFLWDVLDTMQDKLCGWPEAARRSMADTLARIPPSDLGPNGTNLLTSIQSSCSI